MAKTKQKQELTLEQKLEQALVPASEQPYKIPENWCWVRLGKILYLVQDKFNPQEERSSNLKISPFLKGNGCDSNQGDFNKEEKISLSAKADIPLYERGYIDNPIEADFKIKYIGLEHIEKDNGITDYGYVDEVKSPKNVFKKGDLLYGKLRPYLNKHDVAYFDGVCSTDILVYRSIEPTTTKFANYLFSTGGFIQYAIENSHGINLPRISSNDIANFYFPLPPLPEQQRIVDLIERLFAKLDEAKEKVLAAIDSFELRKAAILHKAFCGELTRRWREEKEQKVESKRAGEQTRLTPLRAEERRAESGEQSLDCVAIQTPFCKGGSQAKPDRGILKSNTENLSVSLCSTSPLKKGSETANSPYAIPESWQWVKLGDLLFPMETKKPTGEYFKYIDIDSIDNIHQKVGIPKLIPVAEAPSRASRALSKDVVLFSMVRPYLKNIAYIDESLSDCIASTGFYVCKCKEELLPFYLYYFLVSKDAIDYLMQFMRGDNSPSIRTGDFLGMCVPLPPLSEQKEIVRILDTLLEKSDRAKELAENALENIDTLKKTILAKAFRGLFGTNRPDEASSMELLKQSL